MAGERKMDMCEYYENKVALVTGAASGIGLALCEALLAQKARVVVMADLNAEKLECERRRLADGYPGRVFGVTADVTRKAEVEEMIRKGAEHGGGRIDLLFNNAGLSLAKAFDETTDDDWDFAFKVNFYGALHAIRAVLPVMRAHGGGHIANTASGIGYVPMAYQSMYSATKAALIGLTGSLRYELWDENIHFSAIIPGTVATPIWQGKQPEGAITPAQSAEGILRGVAANERVVIVTEDDRSGAENIYRPEAAEFIDNLLLDIARKRRNGNISAL